MSVYIDDNAPDWFKALLPFPVEWGWQLGHLLPQPPGGMWQNILSNDPFEDFKFCKDWVSTEHTGWFFERGVYAIAQSRKMNLGTTETTVFGLALYPLKMACPTGEHVYHVTLREHVERIAKLGVLTGRRAEICTSGWREGADFVHAWSNREMALKWPHNPKLRKASTGPWSLVTLAVTSPLFEDPKSEQGGLIFGCDYCVPAVNIVATCDV